MTDVPLAGGKNASLGELFAALGPQGGRGSAIIDNREGIR